MRGRHHDVVADGIRLRVLEAGQGPALFLIPTSSPTGIV
jgi:hypothetical protein